MKQYYYYYYGGGSIAGNGYDLFKLIAPTDLRDLAKSFGWQQLQEAVKDGLYVMNNPLLERRQLVFPMNTQAPDYVDAVQLTLNKLAETQSLPLSTIITALDELKDDGIRFKVINQRNVDQYIPLSYAVNAINGAREVFLSAACTVLRPQYHHPRLARAEAVELVDKSRFRHTEKGSFVLNVSTPVKAIETQGNLFDGENIPFVRQATLAINHSLYQLISAIQADSLQALVDDVKRSERPEISSNLCKAINSFQEEHNDYDLILNFNWARSQPINDTQVHESIRIQRDYFSRIDDVRKELRNVESHKEDVFMASVETLNGELDMAGNRSGEVILHLYQEGETIRAKTILNTEQYGDADRAHMNAGAFIRIKGKLHSGNQPRNLTDITAFDLIMP